AACCSTPVRTGGVSAALVSCARLDRGQLCLAGADRDRSASASPCTFAESVDAAVAQPRAPADTQPVGSVAAIERRLPRSHPAHELRFHESGGGGTNGPRRGEQRRRVSQSRPPF